MQYVLLTWILVGTGIFVYVALAYIKYLGNKPRKVAVKSEPVKVVPVKTGYVKIDISV